jgi:hypothetical protein
MANEDKQFDDALNECLERLLVGGETIEHCLVSYPVLADKLEPLIRTAMAAGRAAAIDPRPEFRARARYQLHATLRETAAQKNRLFAIPRRFRWATAVAMVMVMMLASGGMVAASSGSMPDNPLYPVKLAVEQLRLNLTGSPLEKAELYAEFSNRRVVEIVNMAQKGKVNLAESVTGRLDNNLMVMASLVVVRGQENTAFESTKAESTDTAIQTVSPPAPTISVEAPDAIFTMPTSLETGDAAPDDSLYGLYLQTALINSNILREALATAPDEARQVLLQAIEVSEAGYQQVLDALAE